MTAFMLACYLNGMADRDGIYFRSAASCMDFSQMLSNQTYMKDNEKYTYEYIKKWGYINVTSSYRTSYRITR